MMLFLPIGNVFEKIDLIQMYANKTKKKWSIHNKC